MRKARKMLLSLVWAFLVIPGFGKELIQAPNGTFWQVDVGLKRLLVSSDSIAAYGYNIKKARKVTKKEFDEIQILAPLPERKILVKTKKVSAQNRRGVRFNFPGWKVVSGPTTEKGSQIRSTEILDEKGAVVGLDVTSHNPNVSVMGMGKSRTVTFRIVIEKI